MARDYKPDAAKLQGLVSLGIPMKKKEEEKPLPVPPPAPEPVVAPAIERKVEAHTEDEAPRTTERTKRKVAPKGDYESLFICRNDLRERKTMYVAKELQDKLADVVMSMKNREMTIGIYVENIIRHHFDTYKDEINSLSETKFRKPL